MNILVFSQYYPKVGSHSGVFIHNQNINFTKYGVNVTVLAPTPWSPKILWFKRKWRQLGAVPAKARLDGVDVFYLKYPFLKPSKTFYQINAKILYRFAYRFILKKLFNKNFDLILARPLIPTGYSACLLAKKMDLPLVCEGTGSDVKIYPYYNRTSNRMLNSVIRNADKIMANSRDLAEDINLRAGKKVCSVMYRGVNVKTFKPSGSKAAAKKSLGMDEDNRALLYVGAISAQKGIFDLLAAFKMMLQSYHKANLYLIGVNVLDKDVDQLIKEKDLNGKVHYMGLKPQEELVLWYNACEFLVLPSYSEGMPNVVFEAMACMKPVIATPVGGIPEVVDHNITGILVGVGEISSLAEAMLRLLVESSLAEAMGKNALEKIKAHFVDTERVRGPLELLKNLLLEKTSVPFSRSEVQ